MNNVVTVLMSTYNGEKYLREQIDSILSQKDVYVRLIIRDDGSKDATVRIIKEYVKKYQNVSYISGENIGYANSFLTLVSMADDSDYYAFADQDDIWKENKLEVAINKLCSTPYSYSVYASNLEMVDEKGEYISTKKFNNFKDTVGGVLSRNRLAGCTMVFGREVRDIFCPVIKELIRYNTFIYGHDGWVLLCAILYGGHVIVDKNSYILYRRHNNTVTSSHGGLQKRIKNEIKIFWNKDKKRMKIAAFLLKNFSSNLGIQEQYVAVLRRIYCYKKNIKVRFQLLFGHELDTNIPAVDLKNKFAVLLGRY